MGFFLFKFQFIGEIKVRFDKRNAMHRASTSQTLAAVKGRGTAAKKKKR